MSISLGISDALNETRPTIKVVRADKMSRAYIEALKPLYKELLKSEDALEKPLGLRSIPVTDKTLDVEPSLNKPYDHYVLMFYKDEMIGFSLCNDQRTWQRDTMNIGTLVVSAKHRGKGYGRLLINSTKDALRDLVPHCLITITVLVNNTIALKLYREAGFTTPTHTMLLCK